MKLLTLISESTVLLEMAWQQIGSGHPRGAQAVGFLDACRERGVDIGFHALSTVAETLAMVEDDLLPGMVYRGQHHCIYRRPNGTYEIWGRSAGFATVAIIKTKGKRGLGLVFDELSRLEDTQR